MINPSATPTLAQLEQEARRRGLLLRLQVGRPAGLAWGLRVGVARRRDGADGASPLQLLGELKGWALPTSSGLRIVSRRRAGTRQPWVR